jgi:hypothetical protein
VGFEPTDEHSPVAGFQDLVLVIETSRVLCVGLAYEAVIPREEDFLPSEGRRPGYAPAACTAARSAATEGTAPGQPMGV